MRLTTFHPTVQQAEHLLPPLGKVYKTVTDVRLLFHHRETSGAGNFRSECLHQRKTINCCVKEIRSNATLFALLGNEWEETMHEMEQMLSILEDATASREEKRLATILASLDDMLLPKVAALQRLRLRRLFSSDDAREDASMLHRWMNLRDYAEVLTLTEHDAPLSPEGLVAFLKERENIGIVAEYRNCVVSSLLYTLRGKALDIVHIGVAPAAQHRGTGRQFVEAQLKKLHPKYRNRITVQVQERDDATLKFFRSIRKNYPGMEQPSTFRARSVVHRPEGDSYFLALVHPEAPASAFPFTPEEWRAEAEEAINSGKSLTRNSSSAPRREDAAANSAEASHENFAPPTESFKPPAPWTPDSDAKQKDEDEAYDEYEDGDDASDEYYETDEDEAYDEYFDTDEYDETDEGYEEHDD